MNCPGFSTSFRTSARVERRISSPLARFASGHLDDVDAWLERAAPRDRLARVWQLYALERAARERDNPDRADEIAALRRRICR